MRRVQLRNGEERRRLGEAVAAEGLDAERRQLQVAPARQGRTAHDDPAQGKPSLLDRAPLLGDLVRQQFRQRGHEEEEVRPETLHGLVDAAEVRADAERHAVREHRVAAAT